MGLMGFLASDDKKKYGKVETPDPKSFKILKMYQHYPFIANKPIALKVKYKGCSNYKGVKILVYENTEQAEQLIREGSVDPHFLETGISPLARFEPTEKGWSLACKLVDDLV